MINQSINRWRIELFLHLLLQVSPRRKKCILVVIQVLRRPATQPKTIRKRSGRRTTRNWWMPRRMTHWSNRSWKIWRKTRELFAVNFRCQKRKKFVASTFCSDYLPNPFALSLSSIHPSFTVVVSFEVEVLHKIEPSTPGRCQGELCRWSSCAQKTASGKTFTSVLAERI